MMILVQVILVAVGVIFDRIMVVVVVLVGEGVNKVIVL